MTTQTAAIIRQDHSPPGYAVHQPHASTTSRCFVGVPCRKQKGKHRRVGGVLQKKIILKTKTTNKGHQPPGRKKYRNTCIIKKYARYK